MKQPKENSASTIPADSLGTTGQMTHHEFRAWVREMEYPCRPNVMDRDKVPYDISAISSDLGIRPNRFYVYWRGAEEGHGVLVSPSVTRLCRVLLARHRTLKLLSSLKKEFADEEDVNLAFDQVTRSLTVSPLHHGKSARSVAARKARYSRGKDASAEAQNLRNRARKLRRAAKAAVSADSRNRLVLDAEELESRAFELEGGTPPPVMDMAAAEAD